MSVMPAVSGVSGVSGTTGVPGVSGASAGLPGASGASGVPGASGVSGTSGASGDAGEVGDVPAPLAARARLFPALVAVYRAQLSRARVARIPLLFVATFQSIGIMILMRGVVDGGSEARSVVAGSSVLVVAFVALNLLAQYFGQLRASGGLDHYATLPVPPSAVVLGAAAAYASFTVPGTAVTAVMGSVLFQLPMTNLWILLAVIPLSGAALAGLGAALGLLAPRQELATLCGQLGMSAALLLGVLPAARMPQVVSYARDLLPSTYGVEALARSFDGQPDWWVVCADLGVCAGVAVVSLAAATWAYRRAAVR
ncbi:MULTISPECIES: ABC transporter permease [Streptomyces]|uniref:ABC transporter permease n=1 Tax=Streptomyces lycopersici TaxID=2974589 RepID=UPI0021D3910E|nr:ABC transporter permease [Streptomyces sp. NEAU-383]